MHMISSGYNVQLRQHGSYVSLQGYWITGIYKQVMLSDVEMFVVLDVVFN